jgi:hypothetical protein
MANIKMLKTIKCILFHWFCKDIDYHTGVMFDSYTRYKCRKCGRITEDIQNV